MAILRRRDKIVLEKLIDVLIGAIARERPLGLLHDSLHDLREVASDALALSLALFREMPGCPTIFCKEVGLSGQELAIRFATELSVGTRVARR